MAILVSPVGIEHYQSNDCDEQKGWNTCHDGRQKPPEIYNIAISIGQRYIFITFVIFVTFYFLLLIKEQSKSIVTHIANK